MSNTPLSRDELSPAEQFFYDNAGLSYIPGKETPEEGRLRNALEYATAEEWARDYDADYQWSDDWGIDHVAEFPDAYDSEPETCEACLMYIDGELVASLSCIDDADDNYRRIIEAELALEAIAQRKPVIPADDFKVGTRITQTDNGGGNVTVTILRDAEPTEDLFGRKMRKFWARREDTQQEGYISFGPSGFAYAAEGAQQ